MIRLVLLLCGGLYLGLLVLGEDHGQKRYGLMLADQQSDPGADLQPETAPAEVEAVVFIPAQTVMEPAVVSAIVADIPGIDPAETQTAASETAATQTAATQTAAALGTAAAAPLPEPEIPGGTLFSVAASQANVRQGPGTGFAVLGSLTRGEQVLVVLEDSPVKGWSRVRLEGDGLEGYIATRLLTTAP